LPEFLQAQFASAQAIPPLEVAIRLLMALALGGIVAWIYRRARGDADGMSSFPGTLVLLSVLIAMVTQVIGDNIARAFSLVGALSIVRFRTVVRDTQDTAFVIFAVVVGMAVGASSPWVAFIGIVIVGAAAFLMRTTQTPAGGAGSDLFLLKLRLGLGHDLDGTVATAIDAHVSQRKLISIGTAKQGIAIDVSYEGRLRAGKSPEELVKTLNRIEGVQQVEWVVPGTSPDSF